MRLVYIGKEKTKVRFSRMWEKKVVKPKQVIDVDSEWWEVIKSTWLFKEIETTDASNKKTIKKQKQLRKEDLEDLKNKKK